jgi:hypothetical protein
MPMPQSYDTAHRPAYDAVAAALSSASGAEISKMFGMPCLKIDGKAFAGFYEDEAVFKLGGDQHAAALALAGARLFDPSGMGRPMKEWVVVPPAHQASWADLARQALDFVASAPAKPAKARRAKAR